MSARILVVDDIEANRRLLQAKLEARYFEVDLAPNGPAALAAARDRLPDIILLDIMMPGMDGYEVCQRLKQDPLTAHIPVVMVTALGERDDRVKGLRAGAEDFITKPFDDFALFSRIGALMRYNTVAHELRQREASGARAGFSSDIDMAALHRPARLLIVDQNKPASARLKTMVSKAGHVTLDLHESASMDLLNDGVDAIILSAIHQPYDPLRLCARFKMDESSRAVSVIIIVDPSQRELGVQALELGASDIILAPVDQEELLARVATQVRRTRYIDILRKRVDRGMELAVIDSLTGLYNRRFMANHLRQCLNRAAQGGTAFSLVVADIDHFKDVNDTHGHEVGDDVLQEFAQRLKAVVRPADIVCRQGGEEFAILMPNTGADLACAVAERVRRAVASMPFSVSGGSPHLDITVSAGVASYGGPFETVDDLIRRADDALYRAKASGRNRVSSIAA